MRAKSLLLATGLLAVAITAVGAAQQTAAPGAPNPDPRVGLRAGIHDAAQAAWNLKLIATVAKPAALTDDTNPGDFLYMNSDIGFTGHYVVQGNFHGLQVWDIANPAKPTMAALFICPEFQNDVSVYHNLLFASGEDFNGRLDCGTTGVPDSVSKDRMRGIRIFDITDIAHPKQVTAVQTCRGSHTHTIVTSPADPANVYIYVSGGSPVRSPNEMAGCSALTPDKDPNSELFKIEVIQVPLAHPEQARVVTKPAILADLTEPASHGEAPEDVAAAAQRVADWRAKGGLTAKLHGQDVMIGPMFIARQADSVMRARKGTGTPTAADSAVVRDSIQIIINRMFPTPAPGSGPPPGPVQCHDITVYPAIGLAGGACAGYGVLLDIKDPANPKRLASVADSNFSYWHSATFNNAGTKVLFSDEWGGGLAPKCRVTDKHEWGADAIFTIANGTMTFQSYYKMPAAQTSNENCVAHNGSLVPVPGRDIMVQGWYQGGISVFDWTDAAHPQEIAFFDRGPMDSTKLDGAGSWSAYWYNGVIVSSEIGRGLDVFELTPSALLSQNEIDAAKLVHFDYLNVQDQPQLSWPASFVVARAYLDQLERNNGLAAAQITSARTALASAERLTGPKRKTALTQLAAQLNRDATGAGDSAKVKTLAAAVTDLANAKR